ncbi:50S ribosomal protein L18 [Candidatus Izimaplasma bacterium ZiA1]|jgi:large subunit ribosomal protein L18|uniref:50S ribosomal protein L18 n=1 Tax=Candidatus Izimoplasma sp. ZiA1 TaxID=2024899 RepID=UPI000BAA5A5B|nr:50S ribosomal protein L18 [Candidatus Izimaplasma bacterium ZiA1]
MINKTSKNKMRVKRHVRIRQNLAGTPVKPRLSVFRSNKNVYAQIIDDVNGVTLVSASTQEKENKMEKGGTLEAAKFVGELVAKRAIEKNIKQVVFDRSGYLYHGKVKALAEAAREQGLEF